MYKPAGLSALLFLLILLRPGIVCGQQRFFQDKDDWFLKMLQPNQTYPDSSASAVILFEKSTYDLESEFSMNGMMKQKVHQVIRILKPSGVSYGDVNILVHKSTGSHTTISKIKGYTYSLENGQLVTHELSEENVSKDKTDYLVQEKFSMPAVKTGSILDISYTIEGPVSLLFAHKSFQHDIPVVYSELELFTPKTFDFLILTRGNVMNFLEFDDTRKSVKDEDLPLTYLVNEGLSGGEIIHKRWVRRNVPAIVSEPFSPPVANFREQILLRINGINSSFFKTGLMDSWKKANQMLMESFNFNQQILRRHPKASDKTMGLISGVNDPEQKAKTVFSFVRNTINVSGNTDIYVPDDIDQILERQSGSASEINMLLITMLRDAGLDANPLLIGDEDDLSPVKDFPELNQFSKTICELKLNTQPVYLDASVANNGFGCLPRDAYNGYSRVVIAPEGREVMLEHSGLKERSLVSVKTENADPKNYEISIFCQYGLFDAVDKRTLWRKDSTRIRSYINNSLKNLGMDSKLVSYSISGLYNPDTSLVLQYRLHLNWPETGNVYLNPHFISYFSENPFKSIQRKLPVAMPANLDLFYDVQLQIPPGYSLEDAPKPEIVTLEESDAYKYLFGFDPATSVLSLSSRIHTEHTFYTQEHYEMLREFFEKIVQTQQKTYVFKKP